MSDLNERVDDVMEQIEDCISPNNRGAVKHRIRKALQEQDRITREACSEDIEGLDLPDDRCLFKFEITEAIISCKGGIE